MLRNPGRLAFSTWRGHNTFLEREEADPQTWYDSNNVIVNAKGHAEVLRSPKAFGNPIPPYGASESSSSSDGAALHGLTRYRRAAGDVLIIDKGDDTYYLTSAGGAPTPLRSGQDGDPWVSLTINDRLHRIDTHEFIQILPNLTGIYRNGITGPTGAPVIEYIDESSAGGSIDSSLSSEDESGGSIPFLTSVQLSYAYMNETTGHVSAPSGISNVLGASGTAEAIRFSTVASAQTGVNKIVVFITVDGGNIPFLLLDCDGNVKKFGNTTGDHDIVIADILRDTLTPEPIYNDIPPTDATFMFAWKDRIVLIRGRQIQYSGFESCYIGVPHESWPPLNIINIPTQDDIAVGGISTNAGALIMGQKDSYIISGYPSDKTTGPNNAVAITEHMEPKNWGVGTLYPKTIRNTPYGTLWVDQDKRVRNWNLAGYPIEIGMALRSELDAMGSDISAEWYQHGKNSGYYAISDGTKILFIMLYLSSETGQLQFGYGKSDLNAPAMATALFTSERFFFADGDQVYEILNPTQQGDGWPTGTEIFFKNMLGNDMNYSHFHSLRLEGDTSGLTVRVGSPDDTNAPNLIFDSPLEAEGDKYALVDQERRRHMVHFKFDLDDSTRRIIDGFCAFVKNKQRLI